MQDDEIVYDEDTGPPLSPADLAAGLASGVVADGLQDFQRKMKQNQR